MVLEKILESPLDCNEIKPVNPKGNQSWIFVRRTDAEAEAPILWPPDAKNWLTGKDPDAGKDWRQEKRTTEDETVGWHHWLNGHEFEQAPGVGDGQGSLACCSPWGCKELDKTEQLNWTALKISPLPDEVISSSWCVSVNSGLADSFVHLAKLSPLPAAHTHTHLPCSGHIYLPFAITCVGEWLWNEDPTRTPGVPTVRSSVGLKWEEKEERSHGSLVLLRRDVPWLYLHRTAILHLLKCSTMLGKSSFVCSNFLGETFPGGIFPQILKVICSPQEVKNWLSWGSLKQMLGRPPPFSPFFLNIY